MNILNHPYTRWENQFLVMRRLIVALLVFIAGSPVSIYGDRGQEKAPFFDAVMKLMEPLQYTGMKDIVGRDVKLEVSFSNKIWVLHNAHHFDSKGSILLDEGRGGKCGELTRYVYGKVKPLFDPGLYEVRFAKAKERDYFYTPDSTHLIILITDKSNHQVYLLDPSFKRYGLREDFKEYTSFVDQDPEVFLKHNINTDLTFDTNHACPILMRQGHLLTFSVESINGKFDKNHFILGVVSTKRQSQSSEYIFALRYEEGDLQATTNQELLKKLLTPEEANSLGERLTEWCKALGG